VLLKPDPNTLRPVPRAKEPTAQIIHDCFDPPETAGGPNEAHRGGHAELLDGCDQRVRRHHFIQTYSAIKEVEYREYFEVISPWERRFLLLHV
jgi:glutamine synthetase